MKEEKRGEMGRSGEERNDNGKGRGKQEAKNEEKEKDRI